jgi:uncharacterized protein YndB with AHSA1/START domain
MRFKLELLINRPRSEVWQAFNDSEKMKSWQPSLVKVEPLRGIQGQPGAESRLTFKENEREFSLVETITHCQEPERFDQKYENQFSSNTVKNVFVEQEQRQTLWTIETEYTFKTLAMKIMGPLYNKNFAGRTQRDMEYFKKMMENM